MANDEKTSEEAEWRVIKNFPGYEITADGRVRDKYNQKERSTKGGYVMLQVGKVHTTKSTRLLALEAFSSDAKRS